MYKGSFGRKDRLIKEKRHDVYQEQNKLPEPTLCSECGAVFVNGRWSWNTPPQNANSVICPSCRRVADNYPAGHIEIKGQFFKEHHDEILNLVRNTEKLERGEHPLEKIMSIKVGKDQTRVSTTGIHLARRIGEALARSYKGNLSFQYADDDKIIRVYWQR